MPGRPPGDQVELREHVAFFIGEGFLKLGDSSLRWLANNFKTEVLFCELAKKSPARMLRVSKKVAEIANEELGRIRAEKGKENTASRSHGGVCGQKRANEGEQGRFAQKGPNQTPFKKARRSVSGLRKTNETEPLDKDDGAETDDDAEALSEDNRVDQDRRVESTGTFEGPHFSRISETGRDQEVDDEEEVMTKEEGVGESQGDRPPQSTENPEHERNIKIAMHHESMDDAESAEGTEGNKTPGSREPADISVELGLARRNPKTEATMTEKFLARFPHRRVPSNLSLERILKVCSKLDYIMVKIKLVNYLEHRLYESGTQDSAIPVTTGLNDPHGIFDNIGKIKKHTKHGKIHVTYNRIMFFDSVQAENQRTPGASLAQTLDRLASEKATGVTKELKEELILEYKEEYHKGRRWTDVTKWFGGLGIAIVFIIAGIGGHAVSKEWNEVDRNFLEFLSPYLIKIKDIVQALGEDSLDEYCREGHLPEERIRMIQAVGVTMDDDRMTEASDEEAD